MLLEISGLALIVCGVIVLGIRTFAENKKRGNKNWSWSGLLFIVFTIILVLVILLPALEPPRSGVRYTIDNNLKGWGLVFKMYSNESPGESFPPLTQQDGLWVPDLHTLYPDYFMSTRSVYDPDKLTDAERKKFEEPYYQDSQEEIIDLDKTMALMAQTYVYTGWVVRNDSDVEIMKRCRDEKGIHIGDIESENTHLLWMREGVEDAFITDANDPQAKALAQATIPVMIARPRSNKYYDVVPVLFMDGHVEKIPLDTAPEHIKALIELFPEPKQ
jgi:prepilin-type processing-associated H-X9-DG protein